MTAGPFTTPPFSPMQSSGLGIVPKKTGRLRVIHHLSAREGSSVNNGIPADKFSLKNTHVDDAVRAIMSVGCGALLTKLDIRNAFRLIPVSPDDWPLLFIGRTSTISRRCYRLVCVLARSFSTRLPKPLSGFCVTSSPFRSSCIIWTTTSLCLRLPCHSRPCNALLLKMPSHTSAFPWRWRSCRAL